MNTTTTRKACQDCTFWNPLQSNQGQCRRHAPQLVAFEVDDEVRFQSKFPVTAGEDWCGDFQKEG
jgi:hypothetical protein